MWFRRMRIERNIRQLDSADADVCARAAEWLGEHGDRRAIGPLVESVLHEEDDTVRRAALTALVKLAARGEQGIAKELLPGLKDARPEVVRAALAAIPELGDWGCAGPIYDAAKAALKELSVVCPKCARQWPVRRYSGSRCSCSAELPPVEHPEPQPIRFLRTIVRLDPARAYELFAYEAKSKGAHDEIKHAMETAIAEVRDPALVSALGRSQYGSEFLKKELFEAIMKTGEPAVGPLLELLKDRHSPGRRDAAELLGQLKEPRAIDPLLTWLGDKYDGPAAAAALLAIGGPRILDALLAAFAAMTNSFGRERLALVIGTLSDPRAAEPLIAVFRESPFQREKIGAALINNGHLAVLPLDVLVRICDFKDETVYRTVVDYPGSNEKDGWSAVTHEEYSHTISWSTLAEAAAKEIARRRAP